MSSKSTDMHLSTQGSGHQQLFLQGVNLQIPGSCSFSVQIAMPAGYCCWTRSLPHCGCQTGPSLQQGSKGLQMMSSSASWGCTRAGRCWPGPSGRLAALTEKTSLSNPSDWMLPVNCFDLRLSTCKQSLGFDVGKTAADSRREL